MVCLRVQVSQFFHMTLLQAPMYAQVAVHIVCISDTRHLRVQPDFQG